MEKKKKYLILGIIILLVLGGVTVAYLTWISDKVNIGLNSDCFTIDYTKGGDINNAKLKPIYGGDIITADGKFVIREGMALTYANIGIKSSCNIEGYGSLYLDITSLSDAFTEKGESYQSLYYAVLRNTSSVTDITVDNLKDQEFEMTTEFPQPITSTGKIKLLTEQLSNTELNKYIIVIFILNDAIGNDVIGASFSGKISADANQGVMPTPDYCFDYIQDDNNKTLTITDYTCYLNNDYGNPVVTNVNIPNEILVKYTAVTNPSSTVSTACENAFRNDGWGDDLGDICKGGTNSDGNTLQMLLDGDAFSYDLLEKLSEIGSIIQTNYTVMKIGDTSFKKKNLTSVVIPNSVVEIGTQAFSNNNLTKITIPSSVTTLGSFAFLNNKFTNITIGNGISTLGTGIFGYQNDSIKISNGSKFKDNEYFIDSSNITPDYCFNLTKDDSTMTATISKYNCYEGNSNNYETITDVNIPSEIDGYTIKTIDSGSFCKTFSYPGTCYSGNGMNITSVIIPDTVTEISYGALAGNKLTSVVIPDSVTVIARYSFQYNELKSIIIPNSVTTIQEAAFGNNQLTELMIPDSVTYIHGLAFNGNKTLTKIIVDSNNSVYDSRDNSNAIINRDTNSLVLGCKNTVISDSVTRIEENAFSSMGLTDIIIPSSVTSIGSDAFSDNQLTNLIIPESVTYIGNSAFFGNQLTSVTIPDSVTTIGRRAFSMNNLSYVLINSGSSLENISSEAFKSNNSYNPNLSTIYNNSGKAFDWNKIITSGSGTSFVTGEVTTDNNFGKVVITTGQPS